MIIAKVQLLKNLIKGSKAFPFLRWIVFRIVWVNYSR
jgi:hypothetical protein